jgi:4-amino-4-deoxy-L-arabinose transferase-like glycosyltransferase
VPAGPLKPRIWRWDRWALVALLLLAWAVRLPPALDNRFHADEALYAYWGLLIGRGQDPWLVTAPVDKPPLLPYLVGGSQALFGNSEFVVRLPGLAAGLLTIPLVAALSYVLYRHRWAATGAAVGVALSPFAILFSATAFTDPLMVALGLGTCVAAVRGQLGGAGLLAGLAFATKQTGLAWVPVALGLNVVQRSSPKAQTPGLRSWAQGLGSILIVVGLMAVWDVVRVAQGARSFWWMGAASYGGLRLIWPQELWVRLRGWIALARTFFASPVVNGGLLVGLALLVWSATTHRRFTRGALTDLFLVSFLVVYALFHWLWAFPVWDRYLLPLVPVLALLLGRILSVVTSWVRPAVHRFDIGHWLFVICHLSFVILLAFPAWNAAHSHYPVGGDHGAYDGIDEVAAFLRDRPAGTVVYQHWLGWHYADYLFGAPIYLAYWPTPAWLARDVRAFGTREPRYVAFPSWESSARVERALADAGYELAPVLTTTRRDGARSFTVYRIREHGFQDINA